MAEGVSYAGVQLVCVSKTALYTPRGPGVLLVVYDLWGQAALVVSFHYMQQGPWVFNCLLWSRAACPEVLEAPYHWPGP